MNDFYSRDEFKRLNFSEDEINKYEKIYNQGYRGTMFGIIYLIFIFIAPQYLIYYLTGSPVIGLLGGLVGFFVIGFATKNIIEILEKNNT